MIKNQPYGLQALTPIPGQVIQSAPAWGGPFNVPPMAPAQPMPPKPPSPIPGYAGMAANLIGTAACMSVAGLEGGFGIVACPMYGQILGSRTTQLYSNI